MKTKLSAGNIFGFAPDIYLNKPYWGKLDELWSAQLENYTIKDQQILISFNWQQNKYNVVVKQNGNSDNLQGRIIADGDAIGKIFLTKYSNKSGNLYWGEWVESEKKYNVLIETIFELVKN